MGVVKTGDYHRGLTCLIGVGMKTKGWLRAKMKMVQADRDEEEVSEKHDRYIYKRKCSLTRVRFIFCRYKDKEFRFTDCTSFALMEKFGHRFSFWQKEIVSKKKPRPPVSSSRARVERIQKQELPGRLYRKNLLNRAFYHYPRHLCPSIRPGFYRKAKRFSIA